MEKTAHIWYAEAEHIESPGEPCLSPARHCHGAGSVAEVQKVILTSCQANCFRMVRNMVSPVNFISLRPMLLFPYYEVSFLIRSNAAWNTMTEVKVCWKSMDGSFGRRSSYSKGKSVYRVSVYYSKSCHFPTEESNPA